MLSREAHEEIEGLLRELAVAAFLHDTRVPWIIDALLDGELNEEIQGRSRACFAASVCLWIGGMARDAEEGIGGI